MRVRGIAASAHFDVGDLRDITLEPQQDVGERLVQ